MVNTETDSKDQLIIERFIYLQDKKDATRESDSLRYRYGAFFFEFLFSKKDSELLIPEIMIVINSFKIDEEQNGNESVKGNFFTKGKIFSETLKKS